MFVDPKAALGQLIVVNFSAVCLFVFLALQPTVVVFPQPGSGL
jgi:hypothetical protein